MMESGFEAGMNIDRSQNSHIVAPNERSYCEKGTYKVEPQSSFAYTKSRHIVGLVGRYCKSAMSNQTEIKRNEGKIFDHKGSTEVG
jgi:hypothetical protein